MTYFLDTETTGLHGAELVEVGIVDELGNTVFETLVNPGFPIPEDAIRIHGITNEMVADAWTPEEAKETVKQLLSGQDVVIFNDDFDSQFFPGIYSYTNNVFCCMQAMMDFLETERYISLLDSCDFLNVDYVEGHRAVIDANYCRQVWQKIDQRKWLNKMYSLEKKSEEKLRKERLSALIDVFVPTYENKLPEDQNVKVSRKYKGHNFTRWEELPAGLNTKTTLGKWGLKVSKNQKAFASISINARYGINEYDLYAVKDCVPKASKSEIVKAWSFERKAQENLYLGYLL